MGQPLRVGQVLRNGSQPEKLNMCRLAQAVGSSRAQDLQKATALPLVQTGP